MWEKKLIVSNHVKERYIQRKMDKSNMSIEEQIKRDLKPLGIRLKERISDNKLKVTTTKGRVYIIKEFNHSLLVQTVYGIDLKDKIKEWSWNRKWN